MKKTNKEHSECYEEKHYICESCYDADGGCDDCGVYEIEYDYYVEEENSFVLNEYHPAKHGEAQSEYAHIKNGDLATVTTQVMESPQYTKYTANLKHIYKYKTGRWSSVDIPQPNDSRGRSKKPKKHNLKRKYPHPMIAIMMFTDYSIETAFSITRAFNAITERSSKDSTVRFAPNAKTETMLSLDADIKNKYFQKFKYKKRKKKHTGYTYRRGNKDNIIHDALNKYVDVANEPHQSDITERTAYRLYMPLKIENFKQMNIRSKFISLKYAKKIMGGYLYIEKNTAKSIGNRGRASEVAQEYENNQRYLFEYYGWDLGTALQSIWLTDVVMTLTDEGMSKRT